jgi:ribosomal protein S18 acetylase RimI-like enzyme
MASILIRRAGIDDAARLAEFAARTFEETFGAENSAADMAAHLAAAYGVAQQSSEIRSPDVITLLVEDKRQLAGYAQVRRNGAPIEPLLDLDVELWRFYIDRPWHGRGVAAQLMAAANEAAVALGGRQMWLSVWERNARAIAFYTKCGFRIVGAKDFWVGSDRQTDHVMVADLRE